MMTCENYDKIENDLLDAAIDIGGILDMPHWAAAGLATRIKHTGKDVGDMTIAELQEIMRSQRALHHAAAEVIAAERSLHHVIKEGTL